MNHYLYDNWINNKVSRNIEIKVHLYNYNCMYIDKKVHNCSYKYLLSFLI